MTPAATAFWPPSAATEAVTVALPMAARSVLPHGGGAVAMAILIAGIVVGGITLTVAVDRRANPVIWPLAAFLITVLACSLVLDALS